VVSVTGDLIQQTRTADLSRPTPCTEYDVNTLIGHLVAVVIRVAAVARGEDPFSVPQVAILGENETWHEAWLAAAAQVAEDWADAEVLDRDLTLPFGVLPGRSALTVYCGELAVHAWDLATATNRTAHFDEDHLHDALIATKAGLPAEGRGTEMPFDEAVVPDEGAPTLDKLAGWLGRKV
jgi:uncharacterized protein (TIGR03086 family)